MNYLPNILSYWHTSLVDVERMGLDKQIFNNESSYQRVCREAVSNGQISEAIVQILFNIEPFLENLNPGLDDGKIYSESENLEAVDTVMNVLICPIRAVYQKGDNFIMPLWIPAQITQQGELLCGDELFPWISRTLLKPTDFQLTIGLAEDFDRFLTDNPELPKDNWKDYWRYCDRMLESVTGMNYSSFILENYLITEDVFIFKEEAIQGASIHIRRLYNYLCENKSFPPLLKRYAAYKDSELIPCSPLFKTEKHVGQMTGKYSLSPSQRESLNHFTLSEPGEILAINGPPGTGKTFLLNSVVASLWVERAVQGTEPPIILATSSNNQAVTNIIDSFGKASADDTPLAGRWLPDLASHGLYLVSSNRDKRKVATERGFQFTDTKEGGFVTSKENQGYIDTATSSFLERCSAYASWTFSSVKSATEFLHSRLKSVTDKLATTNLLSRMSSAFDEVQGKLDQTLRYQAFLLATHYWEGRWLLETKLYLERATRADKQPIVRRDFEERKWRRWAKLTPCFVSTLYMAPGFFSIKRQSENFYEPLLNFIDLLIVDEAGQCACEVAGATFALAVKSLVVGDMQQLQPVWSIPKLVDQGNLRKHGLGSSLALLELMNKRGLTASSGCVMTIAQNASRYQKYPEQRGLFLIEHRRCIPEIIKYCNDLCYGGRLKPAREPSKNRPLVSARDGTAKHPLPSFFHIQVSGKARRVSGSWTNLDEAQCIADWIAQNRQQLESHYDSSIAEIVGVVTPFSQQSKTIQSRLDQAKIEGLTVGTVHRLQGAERHIIIFSTVYDALYKGSFFFDRDARMLNVAVSRAKDSFIVVGERRILSPKKDSPSGLLARFLKVDHEAPKKQVPTIVHNAPIKQVSIVYWDNLEELEKIEWIRRAIEKGTL